MSNHSAAYEPLAARMRPRSLDEYQGQEHLLASDKPLYKSIISGQLHSMVLWGPAGSGKTSLARLLAQHCKARFVSLSAVMSGVKEIKSTIDEALFYRQQSQQDTLVFVDEVHRFNKAQQDVFLPFIEDGSLIFVGASTENPSFELNSALLSRCQVYRLKALKSEVLERLIQQCIDTPHADLDPACKQLTPEQIRRLAALANGDARRVLNLLENLSNYAAQAENQAISDELIDQLLSDQGVLFDKQGDIFYEQISALHKSMRGSDPDATLYWLASMLAGGCDPLYIARRGVRMASEDIGNADPRALTLALNAWDVQSRLGSPEGELAIAQALTYMACAPKSNAVYTAFNRAQRCVKTQPAYAVPLHLRNAPTQLMKEQGYAQGYRYAHDEEDAFAAGECYLPEPLKAERFYYPVNRGLEKKIKNKLDFLAKRNQMSPQQRH